MSEIITGSALPVSGPLPSLQGQPAVITAAGERASYRFLEFFTAGSAIRIPAAPMAGRSGISVPGSRRGACGISPR